MNEFWSSVRHVEAVPGVTKGDCGSFEFVEGILYGLGGGLSDSDWRFRVGCRDGTGGPFWLLNIFYRLY